MIGRDNENHIDVGALQHFLVVNVRLGPRRFASCHVKTFLVNITERHDFDVRLVFPVLEQIVKMIRAAGADADQANVYAVVRSQHAAPSRGSRKGRAAQSGCLHEIPSGYMTR